MSNPIPTLTVQGDGPYTGSATFTVTVPAVDGGTPTATIARPYPALRVAAGYALALVGSGTDGDGDALAGSALAWSSDVDGALGTGTSLTVSSLSAGAHTITLTATDGAETATDTFDITVLAAPATTIDYSALAVASGTPSGHAEQWVSSGVTSAIVADADAMGGKVLRRAASSSSARRLLAWTGGGSRADGGVLAVFDLASEPEFAGTTPSAVGGLVLRASGGAATETGIWCSFTTLDTGERGLRINEYNAGTAASDDEYVVFPWVVGTRYVMRFEADDTVARAKVWAAGAAEPASWTIEAPSRDVVGAGYAGAFLVGQPQTMDVELMTTYPL